LAEHLEEDLVGVNGHDRVQEQKGEWVVAQGPVEELLLRLAQTEAGRLAALTEVRQVGRAVLGNIAIIAADEGVERGQCLAEEKRLLEDAVEAHRITADVAEQGQLGRAAAGDQ